MIEESPMFLKHTLAGGLIAMSTLAAVPAKAIELQVGSASIQLVQDSYGWEHEWSERRGLSPRELRRALRQQGYRDIEILDRGRRTLTVQAENYRGRDYILRVSARTGVVISARRLRHGGGDGYGGGWDDRDGRDDDRERCWLPEGCSY
jgi:hypothetical protein